MLYLFILGRDPALALAEIESTLEMHKLDFRILEYNKTLALVELSSLPSELLEELAGTIKIAQVLCRAKNLSDFEYELRKLQLYPGMEDKVYYDITSVQSNYSSFFQTYLKDYFKQEQLKGILRKELSPSQLAGRTGFLDFILYKDILAKTCAVLSPKRYKERDLGRPAVDYMKTISIRLAKMLVNLAGLKKGMRVLDPFCGSGTILQEAMLKGIQVSGCDSDSKAIEETRKNLKWIQDQYKLDVKVTIFHSDAREFSKHTGNQHFDAIVTEPYLGPYFKKLPTLFEAREIVEELQPLYQDVLTEAASVLERGKKVVMVFPQFKTTSSETLRIHVPALAKETGFKVLQSFPYAYQESKILREIYVFERE